MKKKAVALLLVLSLVLGLLPATAMATGRMPFTDVKETDWFYDAVQYVYEKDMMNGTGESTFSPDITTTRGMIVTILYRLEGLPSVEGENFTDVSADQYYSDAVAWASANNIVNGYGDGTFGPNDPITREQLAAILYRYMQYKGYATEATGDISEFTDGSQVSSYAVEAMNWAVGVGLISGVGNNTLAPKDIATRAQVAMILMRFCTTIASVSYTVTFEYNYDNKGVYKTVTVEGDKTVDKPTNPTRSGYSFDGWYTAEEDGEKFHFDTVISADITLYAQWSKTGGGSSGSGGYVPPSYDGRSESGPYSITFDSAGGSTVPEQIVEENQIVVEPEDPERDGYIFLGWLTDEDEYFEFDEVVNKNLTLTADWVKESEIDYGLDDILRIDSSEPIEQSLDGNGSITDIGVTYELNGPGKVVATQVKTGSLLRIPGYLTAVDINAVGGTVTDAVIAFHYDPAQLVTDGIDPEDLAIVWYDEANDVVVLLDSQVDTSNNIVSVSTSHFSEYAVVNVAEWMAAQTTQLPTIRTDEVPYYSIVMAMDCSGSMNGEKMRKSIEAAQNMINVLADEDRVTLFAFESSTKVVLDQVQLATIDGDKNKVDNRDTIKSKIGSLSASGGTDIEKVLQHTLQSKSNDTQYQSFVILLSDGQSSVSNSTLSSLKANGQRVISVGIGSDVDQRLMQRIADATDGTYLYCKDVGDLAAAFRALQDAYIGSTEDSDGDGLPDLVELTGMRDQYGEIWKTDPKNPDSDGDGISDGEEMGLYHPLAQYPYFQRVSRPDLYTVRSDEAYLLMPEKMMYSLDMANNRIEVGVYVTDGGYRMVPDLLTPPDSDGIAKEYIYSPPRNLKVTLSGLPDGVVIDSLNTVEEGLIPGTMATSHKTTAILSYTKDVALENIKWTVTAENCSEWSGFVENGIKATYVQKTQSIPKTKVDKVESKGEVSQADQAQLDLAQAALDIYKKLYDEVETKSNELDDACKPLKSKFTVIPVTSKKDSVPPDEVYEALGTAILEAMDASKIEKYDTNGNKRAEQIYQQIQGGLK